MARQGLVGRSSRRKMRTTRRDPSKVPATDLVERDLNASTQTSCGSETPLTFGLTRAGATWRRSSTLLAPPPRVVDHRPPAHRALPRCSRGGVPHGRAGQPCRRRRVPHRPRHPSSTPPMPSQLRAGHFASRSQWGPSVTATTIPWPSRSFRASSGSSSTASTLPRGRKHDARPSLAQLVQRRPAPQLARLLPADRVEEQLVRQSFAA